MYWRRFRIAEIPTDEEMKSKTGCCPDGEERMNYSTTFRTTNVSRPTVRCQGEDESSKATGWIEAEVKPIRWFAWIQIIVVPLVLTIAAGVLVKIIALLLQ
jgi:hypothetical protein